jgi:CHAT domain-containing protein/predicted negative regulator of RcsB-dependent stress response
MSYLSQAQGLVDENADPFKMGQISFGLAEALSESGLPEQALIHFQQALDYLRQTQNPNYVGYALWQIGCTHYLLGNYSEAITQLNLALAADEPDGILAAQCHEFLGRVYLATGEREAALRHLQLALNVYSKTANPKEAAQARAVMGQVFEQQGQFQRAADYYKQALTAFEKLADTVNAATVYYALGGLELKRGDYDAAENYLSRSVSHTENLRRVSTSRDLAAAFSANVHERYISYIDCLMRESQKQPERSLDVRAFETSELARARSLTDLLLATQTNFLPGVDAQLAEQEKSLRQSLRVKEDARISLLAKTYKKEELDALNREIASLETKYKQATDTIRARYPAYDQINRPTGWNLDQIKEQVIADDDTALLEYSLGREKSYLWVVTRAGLTSYELPSAQLINESAERVYGLLSGDVNPETEQSVAQAGRQLSQMVLLPAALHLNKRRLIVVADGALNYIPFQFLPTPDSAPEPLIANHEVVYAPSASILGELHIEASRRRQPTTLLAAFGDPVFAPNYVQHKSASAGDYIATVQPPEGERWRQALRDIEPEGDTVDPESIQPLFYSTLELANLREVAGPDSLVATGFDATPEKLAAADLTKYAILHFATHGILDAKRPENSGLFLSMVDREGKAQNGFVGLRDIYALHAPVDLVVLSACRTGLGKDVRGEGLIGLTRGFMYAGASSVMASLWKVDDEATAELMKQFYSNMLQKEMTPAEALRAAQNTVRQKPQWHSPYYWAAFTLQGEYRHVIKPTGANHNYAKIAAGLLLVLITALAWMYWRRRTTRYSTVK